MADDLTFDDLCDALGLVGPARTRDGVLYEIGHLHILAARGQRSAIDLQARISELEARVASLCDELADAQMQARNSHEAAQMWRREVCAALGVDPETTGLGEIAGLIAARGRPSPLAPGAPGA